MDNGYLIMEHDIYYNNEIIFQITIMNCMIKRKILG